MPFLLPDMIADAARLNFIYNKVDKNFLRNFKKSIDKREMLCYLRATKGKQKRTGHRPERKRK